jgi:hypothetical protein
MLPASSAFKLDLKPMARPLLLAAFGKGVNMKILVFTALVFLALPLASAFADEAKADPVEACKAQVAFVYNFDMMNIERAEMNGKISHEKASERKESRHERFVDDNHDCDDLKDD